MSGAPEDYWGSRYRRWVASLSHERLLPTRKVSVLVFATAYAVVFAWRAAAEPPTVAPFLLGVLVTLMLVVRLSNLVVVWMLRQELRRPPMARGLYFGLRPMVNAIVFFLLLVLFGAYGAAYLCLPGAAM